jgi:hypothetical protein
MGDKDLDPGAYIGGEPELAAERIPGGVRPEDDRVAFNASERAADGQPGTDTESDPPERREAGKNR